MKTIAVMLVTLVLSMTACKKESSKTQIMEDMKPYSTSVIPHNTSGPQNPDSKFDEAGRLHNYILEQIELHRKAGEDMNLENAIELIRKIYRDMNLSVPPLDFYKTIPQTIEASREDIHQLIIEKQPYSKRVKGELHELLFLLKQHANETDYNALRAAVVAFEKRVMDSDWTEDEKSIVLQSASVARYSAYYWMSMQIVIDPSLTAARGFLSWVAGAIADVGGFIESFDAGYAGECSDQVKAAAALAGM